MGYRRYVRILLVFLVTFTAYHFLTWEICIRKYSETYDIGSMGDLARMGYLADYAVRKERLVDLPRKHIEYEDYHGQKVDMITIGDSFSMGLGGGRNPFYQDYIASYNDSTVLNLNFRPAEVAMLEPLWKLINNGFMERIKPRYVLLQSIERSALPRYGDRSYNVDVTESIEGMDAALRETALLAAKERSGTAAGEGSGRPLEIDFISMANFKYLAYWILYRFVDRPLDSKTYMVRLQGPMFDTARPDRLLFYTEDVDAALSVTPARVAMLNDNMNRVADALAAMGISFYFMPVVDKLTLYHPYIMDNHRYRRSRFFELLRVQDRRYGLIDTEVILSEMLAEGVKDVFHQDDTHWSYKAPDRIFSTFRFEGASSQKD